MTIRRTSSRFSVLLLLFVAGILDKTGGLLSVSHADGTAIVADQTLPTSTIVAPPTAEGLGFRYDISGGTIKGGNQFQSFSDFSVGTNDIASFNGPAGIQNIISRVTGEGSVSNIDGTIRSTIDGANLYFMNPNGIIFGPNASLDIAAGSFHATTADYIKLGAEGIFYANPIQTSNITVSPPSSFGFLSANPAPIDVQAGVFDFNTFEFTNLFQVPVGQTLSFVGGPVNIGGESVYTGGGFIRAPNGRVNIVSAASTGEATFDGTDFDVDSFDRLGTIQIGGSSIIDGGEVFIKGGELVINDATIWPGFFGEIAPTPTSSGDFAPPLAGGEVNVDVTGGVTITSTDPQLTQPGIQAFNGSESGLVEGDAPSVNIIANSLSLSGSSTAILTDRLGPGAAGDVTITADNVEVRDGAQITLLNRFEGPGATLTINAQDVILSSDGNPDFTGLAAQGDFHPAYGSSPNLYLPFFQLADSGSIFINAANSLSVNGSAEISTQSFAFGNGGDITINAGDVYLVGEGESSGIIAAQSSLGGVAGNLTLETTGEILIENGFAITANTYGAGDGGVVTVSAAGPVTLSGGQSRILSGTVQPADQDLDSFAQRFDAFAQDCCGISIPDYATLREVLEVSPGPDDLMQVLETLSQFGLVATEDFSSGNAGAISITTPMLTMSADTRIETSTGWGRFDPVAGETLGNAGDITASVGSLSVNDGAAIRSRSGIELLNGEPRVGAGNAGRVTLAADNTISISGRSPSTGDGSSISTGTFGDGDGGTISISANQIRINNSGIVSAESGGSLAGQELSGSGLAGDITITAGNKVDMNDGTISTRAVTADGGNIELTAPEWVYLLNSDITTSVESGFGGGGNITIDPQFVILNQSNILANAYGGPGGNITIVADNVISSAQSSIDASSALGINGTVNISNPDQEVAQELAVLPENFLDVTGLINDRCGTAAGTSSLVSAGPGGLAVDPDGYLPSFGTMTNAVYNGDGGNSAINSGKTWWALALDTSALQLAQVTCTR